MTRDCEHGSLARSCVECELTAEVDRLRAGLTSIAIARCLCDGHWHPAHDGPCCGVAGGHCVTCQARRILSGEE